MKEDSKVVTIQYLFLFVNLLDQENIQLDFIKYLLTNYDRESLYQSEGINA